MTVTIAALKPVLAAAKRVVPRAGALPMLSGVRLTAADGRLTVQTTDLNVTYTSSLPATVDADGVVVVPIRDLVTHVKGKGSISLKLDGDSLHIVNGTRSMLRTMPVDEWPRHAGDDVFADVPSYPLDLTAIAEVAAAASGDDARPILCGVLFDGCEIVATDSYRLHTLRITQTSYPKVLIPARALLLAAKIGTTGLLRLVSTVVLLGNEPHVTHIDARITVGDTVFDVRAIEGEFPNYKQLIPTGYPTEVIVDRDSFIRVVEGVKPMARNATPVRLSVEGDELVVSAVTHDVGQAEGRVPCKITGDFPTVVAFNPEFLLDCLTTLTDEKARLGILDSLKPSAFTERRYSWERRRRGAGPVGSFSGDSIRLLMPVRVS